MSNVLEDMLAEARRLWRASSYAEAAEVYRRALELAERTYGPDSVEMIKPLRGLSAALSPPCESGSPDLAAALELQRRALLISETRFGKDTPEQVPILRSMGILLEDMRRYSEAQGYMERALAVGERTYGETEHLSFTITCLMSLFLQMDQPQNALPLAERNLKLVSEASARHGDMRGVEIAYIDVGRCLMPLRRNEEAISHLERGLSLIVSRKPDAEQGPVAQEIRGWIDTLRKEGLRQV